MYIEVFLFLGWLLILSLAIIRYQYRFWADAPPTYSERVVYDVVSKWLIILLVIVGSIAFINLFI